MTLVGGGAGSVDQRCHWHVLEKNHIVHDTLNLRDDDKLPQCPGGGVNGDDDCWPGSGPTLGSETFVG